MWVSETQTKDIEQKNKGMETEEQSKNQQQWTGINNQAETTNSRVQATKMGMSF